MKSYALPIVGFMFLTLLKLSLGQGIAPSPAAEAPSSDGESTFLNLFLQFFVNWVSYFCGLVSEFRYI